MDYEIILNESGEAERLQTVPHTPRNPDAGEIRIRHEAIGVNFVDIYHRTGLYPLPTFPAALGVEGAGIVEAVGSDVTDLQPGDRVAYAGLPVGAYASTRLLPAQRALKLPDTISSKLAAATMLRGLTTHMLLTNTFPVGPDTTMLVHAAAGGLGTLLTRWGKVLGATVIGTVSSEDKAETARQNGADHVLVGRDCDFVAAIRRLTDGQGVHVAYDGIGGETLAKTAQSVRRLGTLASIGQAGGKISQAVIDALGNQDDLSFVRPSVIAYINDLENYRNSASRLFNVMEKGLTGTIGATHALTEAAQAHRALETGKSSGSLLLIP
ncbi:quinone oxidoreductase [Ochrobactrum vermis]|uniref:Quinone oxidoreductase n=1 Tax=Ochrobactrum vermis TaxID=1827297 RepID=A0ABU8PD13_9HYPH|nr:quinone oxidoreductase [Ochrobactrum vermis]PQZ30506.1 alcohol dehydrogenase [Ochrobactrum vermis]